MEKYAEEDQHILADWAFDGYPIQRSVLQMVLHCLAHEILHALLNACCSRGNKMSKTVGHLGAFDKLSGHLFGHPCVPGKFPGLNVSWTDVSKQLTLRKVWGNGLKNIPWLQNCRL